MAAYKDEARGTWYDYLAMIKAVVDMLDGAKYLWQK